MGLIKESVKNFLFLLGWQPKHIENEKKKHIEDVYLKKKTVKGGDLIIHQTLAFEQVTL